jgi:hypothetical protein
MKIFWYPIHEERTTRNGNSPDVIEDTIKNFSLKGLGAIRAKIGPTSDIDKIFSKMYSQYVLFRNKYS